MKKKKKAPGFQTYLERRAGYVLKGITKRRGSNTYISLFDEESLEPMFNMGDKAEEQSCKDLHSALNVKIKATHPSHATDIGLVVETAGVHPVSAKIYLKKVSLKDLLLIQDIKAFEEEIRDNSNNLNRVEAHLFERGPVDAVREDFKEKLSESFSTAIKNKEKPVYYFGAKIDKNDIPSGKKASARHIKTLYNSHDARDEILPHNMSDSHETPYQALEACYGQKNKKGWEPGEQHFIMAVQFTARAQPLEQEEINNSMLEGEGGGIQKLSPESQDIYKRMKNRALRV